MNRSLILVLFNFCFCTSLANIAFADTANKDVYTREVLKLDSEFLNVLKSDISKEKKCDAVYGHIHSNTRDLFVTMGRLQHSVVNFNELIQQYSGVKHLEDVADVLWPKLQAVAKNPLSKFEYFMNFCHELKNNFDSADLLNQNREYVSTVYSDRNKLVMKTRLDDFFVYLTFIKENNQWKLFNSTRTLPPDGALSATDKKWVEQFMIDTLMIEKFNTQCYRLNKIFLDQNDVKVFLKYRFGDTVDIPYKGIIKVANNDADTFMKETINIFNQFGDCDKVEMKQATFVVSMKMTEGVIDTLKKAVFKPH